VAPDLIRPRGRRARSFLERGARGTARGCGRGAGRELVRRHRPRAGRSDPRSSQSKAGPPDGAAALEAALSRLAVYEGSSLTAGERGGRGWRRVDGGDGTPSARTLRIAASGPATRAPFTGAWGGGEPRGHHGRAPPRTFPAGDRLWRGLLRPRGEVAGPADCCPVLRRAQHRRRGGAPRGAELASDRVDAIHRHADPRASARPDGRTDRTPAALNLLPPVRCFRAAAGGGRPAARWRGCESAPTRRKAARAEGSASWATAFPRTAEGLVPALLVRSPGRPEGGGARRA